MEVREAKLVELPLVLALYDEYDRTKATWPTSEQQQAIFAELKNNGGCILVATEENSIIGTCTLNICPNLSWSGRPYAIIENVIVTKDSRNKGIGKALLNYSAKLAENKNCYKIALMTGSKDPNVLKFYEAAGFTGNKHGFQRRFNA